MSMQDLRSRLRVPLSFALLIFGLAVLVLGTAPAEAKIPGKTHCYFGICHRIKTLAETERLIGTTAIVQSSFYDDCKVDRFNPCTLTSSGEIFRPDRPDNAASPIYPDGTKLLVWNPKTKAAAIIRINSAGPYHGKRTLDVSRATAERLGFKRAGVATLHVQVLSAPTPQETRYKKHRTYAAVPGPIGNFDSFAVAVADLGRFGPEYARPVMVAAAPEFPEVLVPSSPMNNKKAVNAAGHNATIVAMASVGGGPAQTTAFSASAILMNSVPYSLLPAGVLTEERGRTSKAARKAVVAERSRRGGKTAVAWNLTRPAREPRNPVMNGATHCRSDRVHRRRARIGALRKLAL